jgi:hypothetical protein
MCSWLQSEDEGEQFGSPIACPHCVNKIGKDWEWMSNTVGCCLYLDKKTEEPELRLYREYHTGGIKWEDYLADKNILEKY